MAKFVYYIESRYNDRYLSKDRDGWVKRLSKAWSTRSHADAQAEADKHYDLRAEVLPIVDPT